MKQNRFKSWALWLSVLGGLWVVGATFGLWEYIGITDEVFHTVTNAVGSILIAFGIVNNPTDQQRF